MAKAITRTLEKRLNSPKISRGDVSKLHERLVRPILRQLSQVGVTETRVTSLPKWQQTSLHLYLQEAVSRKPKELALAVKRMLEKPEEQKNRLQAYLIGAANLAPRDKARNVRRLLEEWKVVDKL